MLENTPTILQVLPELRTGGVERGTVEMANAITQAGWRALVASQGGEMVSQVLRAGAEHIKLPLASKNPLVIWKNAAILTDIIVKENVSIIHARSRAPAWSALIAAKRTNIPLVTTFHGTYSAKSRLKKYYNSVMIRGEQVIAVSNFIAEHIMANYDMDADKLRVVQRGVDLSKFGIEKIMPTRMAELVQKWHIDNDGLPIILLPGRVTRWKGHEFCVRALAKIPHRNFTCLFVGDEEKHPAFAAKLRELIKDIGLEGRVRLVGNTPWMNEAYALARLIVTPSIEPEAFGRVPIEAQSVGRPVIATRHGGACETIIDAENAQMGKTGWLVAVNDEGELAEKIAEALELDENEYQAIAANAVFNVQNNFSSEVMCNKTLNIYQELL